MRLGNFSRVLPGISFFAVFVAVALCAARGAARLPGGPSRVLVPDSVVLPIGNPGDPNHPRILRAQLSAGELAQPFPFSIALRMRDFAGLQARIAAGQRIPRSEMEAKYLPLASDYQKVADWLVARGFTLTQHDINHTLLFATGTAAQVQAAFGVSLARVAAADGNYSAATSAPSLPADLSSLILSVNGLQPYARLRHIHVEALPGKPLAQLSGGDFVAPQDVNAAYHMPTGWTGKGQTICVIDELPVPNADFTQFWQVAQVPQTVANLTVINLGGDTSTLNSQDVLETALDVEWVGAVAPEAKIRLYLAANVFSCFAQIATDQASDPSMSVLSISYVALENALSQGTIRTMSQEFAQMAAAGMSIVASSGDGGSNSKDGTFGSYDASQPAEVGYPASDMNVTGVGGTVVYYNLAWSLNGEQVWN